MHGISEAGRCMASLHIVSVVLVDRSATTSSGLVGLPSLYTDEVFCGTVHAGCLARSSGCVAPASFLTAEAHSAMQRLRFYIILYHSL